MWKDESEPFTSARNAKSNSSLQAAVEAKPSFLDASRYVAESGAAQSTYRAAPEFMGGKRTVKVTRAKDCDRKTKRRYSQMVHICRHDKASQHPIGNTDQ